MFIPIGADVTFQSRLIVAYVLLLFTTSFTKGIAQLTNDKKLSQFVLRKYTIENGLPTNRVLTLQQTKDGFIWMATYNGLVRFDGQEFKTFDIRTLYGLKSNTITDLITDNNGEFILLGTQGKGAYRVKNNKAILLHPYLGDKNVSCLYHSSNGDIWIGTNNQGVFVLHPENNLKLVPINNYQDLRIRGVLEINPREFWIATETKGVIIVKDGAVKDSINTEKGLRNNFVWDFIKLNEKVLIGTPSGLNSVDLSSGVIQEIPEFNNTPVFKVQIDSFQNIWAGTVLGAIRKTKTGQETVSERNGLLDDDVNDIFFDREGSVWFATTRGGLYQLSDGKFTNYNSGDGLSSSNARVIYEWKKGTFLIGSQSGDIDVIEKNAISKFTTQRKLNDNIFDILSDRSGNLWVTSYNGLLKKEASGKEKMFSMASGLPTNLLRNMLIDEDDNLWIGTRDKGVIVMKDDKIVRSYSTANSIDSDLIMCLDKNSRGDVFVGTNSAGFYIFEKGSTTAKQYSTKNGLRSNLVFSIYPDRQDANRVWITTNQGIGLLDKGKLTMVTAYSGIPDESFFDLLEDGSGYFWLTLSKGVLRVSKQELLDNVFDSTKPVTWKLFGAQDGIKSPECLGPAKSLFASDQQIWIPMINGLISIYPDKIKKHTVTPMAYINSVEADGHSYDTAFNEIVMEPGLKRMSIRYGGISYYFNEGVRYKVKLEPYDEKWLDMHEKREAVYTNLPGGQYTFRVQACNSDGVWNETGASFQFFIKPYFYETYVFYLSAGLILFVGVFLTIRLRTKQIERRNKTLQHLIEVKTAQLQKNLDDLKRAQVQLVQSEKMASLGVLTAGIAHEINNPVNFISVGIEALSKKQDQLNQCFVQLVNAHQDISSSEIKSIQEKIKLLINDIKIGTSRTEEIILSLRTFSRINEAEQKLADVNHGIESTLVLLNSRLKNRIEVIKKLDLSLPQLMCYPGQLNQVFMNVLSNAIDAIKTTGTITIVTSKVNDFIEVRIADSGSGISKEIQEKIFEPFFTTKDVGVGTGLGLSISYGIIKHHRGSIEVVSEVGRGTEFIIRLPVTV